MRSLLYQAKLPKKY
jgi:hypothetical protein